MLLIYCTGGCCVYLHWLAAHPVWATRQTLDGQRRSSDTRKTRALLLMDVAGQDERWWSTGLIIHHLTSPKKQHQGRTANRFHWIDRLPSSSCAFNYQSGLIGSAANLFLPRSAGYDKEARHDPAGVYHSDAPSGIRKKKPFVFWSGAPWQRQN